MKKWILLGLVLIFLIATTGCMSLFTALTVEEPVSDKASMLVVEAVDGSGEYLVNMNATGWAPVVVDAQGNVVPFQMVNILADAGTAYFAPNVMAGTYTLKGFRHVYSDYGLLPDNVIPDYEPYVENYYHIRQEFMLDKPVVLNVKESEMASFGKYEIASAWVEGAAGTSDDRWRINPASVEINAEPADRNLLKVIKGITNANWAPWNAKNPETAY